MPPKDQYSTANLRTYLSLITRHRTDMEEHISFLKSHITDVELLKRMNKIAQSLQTMNNLYVLSMQDILDSIQNSKILSMLTKDNQ